ncbi:hypothetical protein AR688_11650 [Rheinheimera sp. EpRS3]|nr:hypothetical protein AR688_11650 [Rheinheimera sp. EpRS3]
MPAAEGAAGSADEDSADKGAAAAGSVLLPAGAKAENQFSASNTSANNSNTAKKPTIALI